VVPRTLVEGRCVQRSSYSCAAPHLRCSGPFPESNDLKVNERDELCFTMTLVEGQTMRDGPTQPRPERRGGRPRPRAAVARPGGDNCRHRRAQVPDPPVSPEPTSQWALVARDRLPPWRRALGINQLDDGAVEPYLPGTVIRAPLVGSLSGRCDLLVVAHGEARRKLACTAPALGDLRRAAGEQDLAEALELQSDLEALRPQTRLTHPSKRLRSPASSSDTQVSSSGSSM